MGRKTNPLYKDPKTGVYYYRRYEGRVRKLLSLSTNDQLEAMQRFPIVQSTKMSWFEYQRTFSRYAERPTSLIAKVGDTIFTPPIKIKTTKENMIKFVEEGIRRGGAKYYPKTQTWEFRGNIEPSDVMESLKFLENKMTETNNSKEIEELYTRIMPQLYIDKKVAKRFADIWLTFLKKRGVKTWKLINEALCIDFKNWRKKTKIIRNNGNPGTLPSSTVINRHFRFLFKSFEEAKDRGYITFNPIKNWKPEKHQTPLQDSLTQIELKKLLAHQKWQQDYLMNGSEKIALGYKLLDIVLLLFTSCKRRSEILLLHIEDINYRAHYAHYKESKNSSKGTPYSIHKAFWITAEIEFLLKRVIGNRTEGLVFPSPICLKRKDNPDEVFNGEYLSEIFKKISYEIIPNKKVKLNNLRHTATDIMEKAGLTDGEVDAALGHHQIKTAIINYQDRSADAIARRLSKRTRNGIEVLCEAVKEFF